jgi:hypothetical protein
LSPLHFFPFLLSLALLGASPGLSQTAESDPARTDGEKAAAEIVPETVAAGGLRAFVDPETGEITANPTPEQLLDLNRVIRERRLTERSAAVLRQGYLPGFGNAVQLGPRMYSSALALPGADGPVLQCSQGEDPLAEAAHLHEASTSPPAGPVPGLETHDR